MACTILIFIGIETSQHLNIFSKSFVAAQPSANFFTTCSFIVDPKRQTVSTPIPSFSIIKLVIVSVVISLICIFSFSSMFSWHSLQILSIFQLPSVISIAQIIVVSSFKTMFISFLTGFP